MWVTVVEIPYSFARGKKGTYVYRRRVPDDMQAIVGKDWWKQSLKTTDKAEARKVARALAAEHDAIIARHRGMSLPQRLVAELNTLRTEAGNDHVKRHAEEQRPERTSLWNARQAAIERLAMQMLTEAEKRVAELSENDRSTIEANGGLGAFWRQTEASSAFNAYLREKAAQDGLAAVLADPEETITPGEAYQRREELERERAELAADAQQMRSRQRVLEKLDLRSPDHELDDPTNPRITTVVEQWLKHQGQSVGAARRHRLAWARFREVFGNVHVREITRAQVLQYRTVCESIPDTRKLPAKDRDMSLAGLAKLKHLPRISSGTVERHLTSVKAMLTWCCSNVADFDKNIADGIVAAKEKRPPIRPFKSTELGTVLAAAAEHYDDTRGRDRGRKRDMLWLIYAACYSGCRLEELCQLSRDNVRQIKGIWVLDVNAEDGRKLKNKFSERIVPVHPVLMERGFIQFAKEGRGPRVFASLKLMKSSIGMSYGNAASSSFGRFLDKIGLMDRTLNFHSFRHTLIDAMRNAEVPYSVELAIAGHQDKLNPVHGGYGSRQRKVELLAKHMAVLDPLA